MSQCEAFLTREQKCFQQPELFSVNVGFVSYDEVPETINCFYITIILSVVQRKRPTYNLSNAYRNIIKIDFQHSDKLIEKKL